MIAATNIRLYLLVASLMQLSYCVLPPKGCIMKPHNYPLTTPIRKNLLKTCNEVVQDSIKNTFKQGTNTWSLALNYHYTHNLHHNYSTVDTGVGQEIGLDFFSSALVSCLMADEDITAGKVKRAYRSISTWDSYIKGSHAVKEGVDLVRRALYRHYRISDETEEEDIPSKPYDVANAAKRYATEELLLKFKDVTGYNQSCILEKDLLFKLIIYFVKSSSNDSCQQWKELVSVLFAETELGKWVTEIYYHKLLVFQFHDIAKSSNVPGYVVSNYVASAHDNDKYIPFQILSYTLKWYYGDIGVLNGE